MQLIKEMTEQDVIDLKKLLTSKHKMEKDFRPYMIKQKNQVLKDEFATKWVLHEDITEKDLMKLYLISIWAVDIRESFRLLPIVLSDLFYRNPKLCELGVYVLMPVRGENPYETIRDVIAGVASHLNVEDMEYFLSYEWNKRIPEVSEMTELAKKLVPCHKIDWEQRTAKYFFEDEDSIQTLDFVLSETTSQKIIDSIHENSLT